MAVLVVALLLAGCVNTRPPPTSDRDSTTSGAASYSRDTTDCEREAALAGAGDKAQAFAKCMRARDHAPKR
ncbi:MAG: hypothetical protein GEU77_11145 [Deltaproteobacteria bacterium]|nr:hypothetical protein [Deltaproteobacteria bacterium]